MKHYFRHVCKLCLKNASFKKKARKLIKAYLRMAMGGNMKNGKRGKKFKRRII